MEPEGPPQARRVDGARLDRADHGAVLSPLFWPFWRPWGDENLFLDDGAGSMFYKQNNFNFTGPLIILTTLAFWLSWRFWAKKWFTGPKVQGSPEECGPSSASSTPWNTGRWSPTPALSF